jgi:mannose-6-phosphate isomerase-like protein (cupin superfamily)
MKFTRRRGRNTVAEVDWHFSLASVLETLGGRPDDPTFHYPLQRGSMKIGLYAPRGRDPQQPHPKDELYIIVSGTGEFVKDGERRTVKPQDVLFVEAGTTHRFENFSENFSTWVIFWGPDGGKARYSFLP